MKKLFTLAAAVLASVSMWAAVDYSSLNYNGEDDLPSGYKYYGSSAGNENKSAFSITTCDGVKVFDVTAGGGGTYNKRAIEFTITEDCSVEVKLHTGNNGRVFSMYNGTSTAVKTVTLETKGNEYTFTYDFTGATAQSPKTYSFSGSGSKTYISKITFASAGPSSDPVTSITVNGPEAGYIGLPVTLTATPDVKADTIWWTDQYGTKQESKNGVFTFTPSAAGSYTYTAWAENANNENPVTKEHSVTVTKLCGELIRATRNGKNLDPVTGIIGGTAAKSTQDDGKLGKDGHYWKLTLASGNFMIGDTVIVNVSAAAQQGVIAITSDQAATNLLGATEDVGVVGDNKIVLTKGGVNTIWLVRVDASNKWNGYVDAISVTRPCEESDNNNASVTINGEAAEKSGTVFNYTLSNSYTDPTVDVVITLEHPLATLMEEHAASFTMPTPEVGTPSVETFKVKAENGEQAWYSIFVNKAASLNDDATLSALSVEGYTLTPAFDAETTAYTITKAYKAANPAESKVSATPNDANANAVVVLEGDVFTITVTAEDNTTTKVYTITILEADAKKDLLRVTFSNGVHGYILNGNIQVPYLAGEAEPTFVSAEFWNPDGEPTAEVVDGKLVVTGADSKTAEYTFEFVELTPMGLTYDLVTFTEVPDYIFSVYGFDADKGVKFSKDVEEASNRRISEGKDRIYIALPAAQSVTLTSGTSERPVRITLNGKVLIEKKNTPATGKTFTIQLDQSNHNLLGFESNENNGDAGFVSLQLNEAWPTGMDNTDAANKAIKAIENDQIVIIKNGVRYNVLGAVLK